MHRAVLLALAALGVGLVCVVAVALRSSPPISVGPVKMVQTPDDMLLTLEITNNTANSYLLTSDLEIWEGGWSPINHDPAFTIYSAAGPISAHTLGPHRYKMCSFPLSDPHRNAPFRARVFAQKNLVGLAAVLRRVSAWIQQPSFEVNPFNVGAQTFTFQAPIQFFSQEFRLSDLPVTSDTSAGPPSPETWGVPFTVPSLPASAEPEPTAQSPGSQQASEPLGFGE